MDAIPQFEEGLARWSEFLCDQGYRASPLWFFREDVSFSLGRYWMRLPLPANTELRVRALYEEGRTLGFGIRINALFHVDQRACCYLEIPRSHAEAQESWSSGFVLSAVADAPEARVISGALRWRLRRWLNGVYVFSDDFAARLPSRSAAAA